MSVKEMGLAAVFAVAVQTGGAAAAPAVDMSLEDKVRVMLDKAYEIENKSSVGQDDFLKEMIVGNIMQEAVSDPAGVAAKIDLLSRGLDDRAFNLSFTENYRDHTKPVFPAPIYNINVTASDFGTDGFSVLDKTIAYAAKAEVMSAEYSVSPQTLDNGLSIAPPDDVQMYFNDYENAAHFIHGANALGVTDIKIPEIPGESQQIFSDVLGISADTMGAPAVDAPDAASPAGLPSPAKTPGLGR